jgi:hypothetical protein
MQLAVDLAEAQQETARANESTEKLRAENLSLEKKLAPRRWYGPSAGSMIGGATGTELFRMMEVNGELSKYRQVKALIQSVPEYDAQYLAQMIHYGLAASGWAPETLIPAQSGIAMLAVPDGVQIWTRSDRDIAWRAAEALSASLASEGIQAEAPTAKLHRDDPTQIALSDGDIRNAPPSGAVVILVGAKPGFIELRGKLSDEYRKAHPDEK